MTWDEAIAALPGQLWIEEDMDRPTIREIRRLISSGVARGWLRTDDDRLYFERMPSGSQTRAGQLMGHSLAEIAMTIQTCQAAGQTNVPLADLVVGHLGYSGSAGRTARKIVRHIAGTLSGS